MESVSGNNQAGGKPAVKNSSLILFGLLLGSGCKNMDTPGGLQEPRPPVAEKIPKVDFVHGLRREDDYFWLREKTNRAVLAYLEAENRYTDARMESTGAFQATLYHEMVGA